MDDWGYRNRISTYFFPIDNERCAKAKRPLGYAQPHLVVLFKQVGR